MYEHNLILGVKRSVMAGLNKLMLCCFLSLSVYANAAIQQEQSTQNSTISSDFNEPVTLDSKDQRLDGKRKIFVYIDNVVITQGSLRLLADLVEVDASAGVRKEVITAKGKPATYSQRQDDGTMVVASANEIIYSVESRTISLKGDASIDQSEVQVTGNSIIFDMAKEQIVASTGDGEEGSVRTVISPGAFNNEADNEKNNDDSPQ